MLILCKQLFYSIIQTTCGDIKNITVEDRLVKHIADEILRNNKYLRNIHSNNSIRALLENEAHK